MSQTFGSINFGNIPVAAPSGISVAGARQGVSYNAGYIELGSDDPFNTAWWVTDQRFIRVSTAGALWALDTDSGGGFGWRIQSNLMTILNDGEEWSFLQDSGNSYFRIESLGTERGIQWYNTGAPTGERAFVGYNNTAGLRIRDSTVIGGGIKLESLQGNIDLSVAGDLGIRVLSGNRFSIGSSNMIVSGTGGTASVAGGTQFRVLSFWVLSTSVRTSLSMSQRGTAAVPASGLDLKVSTTTEASLNLPAGVAPTVPGNGDIWSDGTDVFIRIGGVTKTFTLV